MQGGDGCGQQSSSAACRLLIFGSGGHGRSVAEAVMAAGTYVVAGFVDDAAPVPGNNTLRELLSNKLLGAGFKLVTVTHPRAIVSLSAVIDPGCAIMAGAIVGTDARLGYGVIVNCGAVVNHHTQVQDYGHLGVNACMAGGAVQARSEWMQAASGLGYGFKVADRVVLQPGVAMSG